MPHGYIILLLTFLGLAACGDSDTDPAPQLGADKYRAPFLDDGFESATEPVTYQLVDWAINSDMEFGTADIYSLVGKEVTKLDRLTFRGRSFKSYARYETPQTSTHSYLLAHLSHLGIENRPSDKEALCFIHVIHHGNRNQISSKCNRASTITFYMAATAVLPSQDPPFTDAPARIAPWQEMYAARDNDLIGFLVSAFATVENALVEMGRERFDPLYQSIRPVMETISTKSLDLYQRNGELSSDDLIRISNVVTGNELPLERLTTFFDVYERYAHVEDIQLRHTGGSLTRKGKSLEVLTLANELKRFFVHRAPLEMSDYRTHTVQNVRHEKNDTSLQIIWDPLPHMFGYNIYVDRIHVGSTARSSFNLKAHDSSQITVHAVGHAGEFDGQRYTPVTASTASRF